MWLQENKCRWRLWTNKFINKWGVYSEDENEIFNVMFKSDMKENIA